MLLEYGNTVVNADWQVDEKLPPGFARVYYVYSGEVVYQDELCTTQLKPGYLYIFPSSSSYRMKQNVELPLYCTYMHLDVLPALITDLIEVQVENDPVLKHLISSVSASIDAGDIKIISALADVFELYCKEKQLILLPARKISNVLLYIANNIEADLTVEELSRLSGYNKQYFIRYFKRIVGLSPHQYVINYRLKEAIKLLKTDVSVMQVAKMTGYSDLKSFSRAFKDKYDLSPSAFRQVYNYQP